MRLALLCCLLASCASPGGNRVLRSVTVGYGETNGSMDAGERELDSDSYSAWLTLQPLAWIEDEPPRRAMRGPERQSFQSCPPPVTLAPASEPAAPPKPVKAEASFTRSELLQIALAVIAGVAGTLGGKKGYEVYKARKEASA